MKVGLFTALLAKLSLDEVIKKIKSLGIRTVELGTGNYIGDPYLKLDWLSQPSKIKQFKQKIEEQGINISALSCHGNPLHPNKQLAELHAETNRKTISLAEKLGVTRVIDFSGCPGDSDDSKYPNWSPTPWPPDYQEILKWQWEKKVIPYWTKRAKFAEDHGVRIAIEMHPGFVVYNPETMSRLRQAAGPAIGCNFDPSHMFWQGIDPNAAIRALSSCIFHVHAKDSRVEPMVAQVNGVLDNKPYAKEAERSWIFRTVGYGHDFGVWKDMVSTLRIVGYDYVMSIEHEDSLMSGPEGLRKAVTFLKAVMVEQPRGAMWWD
jgi:sugar phosphate isomerase/epimerase